MEKKIFDSLFSLVLLKTSLAQLKIGLKTVFEYMEAWRMFMVPDQRIGGRGHL